MLNNEQITSYKNEGYAVQTSFLSALDIERLVADVQSICGGATLGNHDSNRLEMEPNQASDGSLVRRICHPCTYYDRFISLSESSELLDCVEQLLGHNVQFHYSKLNIKPPRIGSVVEWHQDLTYYPLTNNDSLAIVIYLDGASHENGCLQVLPGRHMLPAMDHTASGVFQGKITGALDESESVFLEGAAGTAIFMHGMTPHASAPNRSLKSRRTLIVSYRAADAFPIYTGEETNQNEAYVRLARGEPSRMARLTPGLIAIPRFAIRSKSLYDLQEYSRRQHTTPNDEAGNAENLYEKSV
jgi:ectoine hydroxylase-related dioxygenase (phytanoyl-CoA dioxygenase family)